MPSPITQKRLRELLGAISLIAEESSVEITMTKAASAKWKDSLDKHQAELSARRSLGAEMSSWSLRMKAYLPNLIEVAIAHAANRFLNERMVFNPVLQADDIEFARKFMNQLQRSWNLLESIYSQTKEVEIAEKYHRLIQKDFANQYDAELEGIVVKYTDLTARYCQHPKRDSQFNSKVFEYKVLGELSNQNLAKPHPTLKGHWVISK